MSCADGIPGLGCCDDNPPPPLLANFYSILGASANLGINKFSKYTQTRRRYYQLDWYYAVTQQSAGNNCASPYDLGKGYTRGRVLVDPDTGDKTYLYLDPASNEYVEELVAYAGSDFNSVGQVLANGETVVSFSETGDLQVDSVITCHTTGRITVQEIYSLPRDDADMIAEILELVTRCNFSDFPALSPNRNMNFIKHDGTNPGILPDSCADAISAVPLGGVNPLGVLTTATGAGGWYIQQPKPGPLLYAVNRMLYSLSIRTRTCLTLEKRVGPGSGVATKLSRTFYADCHNYCEIPPPNLGEVFPTLPMDQIWLYRYVEQDFLFRELVCA